MSSSAAPHTKAESSPREHDDRARRTLPRLSHTGKVTQAARRSSRSGRSCARCARRAGRWLVAVLFTIGLPCLFGSGDVVALGIDEPARAGRPPPARHRPRRRQPLAARNRRARRARDHRRVLDRDDPREHDGRAQAAAGALGEGRRLRGRLVPADAAVGADRVLREPGDHLASPPAPDFVLGARRRADGDRRRALPDGDRDLHARDRRDHSAAPRAASRRSPESCS